MTNPLTVDVSTCVRTLRLKVKGEAYSWLNAAAIEVNQVFNWANETSYRAARPFAGPGRNLSAFDLDKLSSGASQYFDRIGSETVQRVNAEFARRRRQSVSGNESSLSAAPPSQTSSRCEARSSSPKVAA